MYGKPYKIKQAQSYVQHQQCKQCHMLTHTTANCRHPAEYKCCGICGTPSHTQKEHGATHCHCLHPTILCNCPLVCFNCTYCLLPAKGHYTFRDDCPLKKNMCQYASAPIPRTVPSAITLPPWTTLAPLAAVIKNAPTPATL